MANPIGCFFHADKSEVMLFQKREYAGVALYIVIVVVRGS